MFNDKSIAELKTICFLFDIIVPKSAKKSDILNLLNENKITEELYAEKMGESFDYKDGESIPLEVKIEDNTTAETKVLLKMVHPRGALNVANIITFTIEEPFKLVKKKEADEIIRKSQGEVREATPKEVASFYGVN